LGSDEYALLYEKELIEAAFAESNGIVAGSNGAAAKLGISQSTLETAQYTTRSHNARI
jgi:hypothetical protein